MASRKEFRTALMEAAEAAHEEGSITRGQRMVIRAATLVPGVRHRLEEAIKAEAMAGGELEAGDVDDRGLDFSSLVEFMKQIMPLILQLIALFSK